MSPASPARFGDIVRFYLRKLLAALFAGLSFALLYLLYTHSDLLNVSQAHHQASSVTTAPKLASQSGAPSPYHPHADDNFEHLDKVRQFWEPWAIAIQASKPPIPEIDSGRHYSNLRLSDSDQHKPRKPPRKLIDLSDDDIANLTAAHATFREKLDHYNPSSDAQNLFDGRGVVIVAGGEYFGPAIVGIHMLRAAGSQLPVEAFVQDWDEYEAGVCEEYLPKLNARCLVISDFLDERASAAVEVGHYQLKSLALLFSSFADALLLDSDSIPLVDPAELFAAQPYRAAGLVGWSDLWKASETPDFYTIAGLKQFPPNLPPACSESGQLLVDKRRHLKTLLLAAHYNIWGPKWFYRLLSQGALGEGDKNTFETAAVVLNATYYRVQRMVDSVGRFSTDSGLERKTSGLVQYMPESSLLEMQTGNGGWFETEPQSERPAFIHANTPKMNAGHLVDEGDLTTEKGRHIRLWGSADDQKRMFGKDVEKQVWELVRDTGCELAGVIKEWKERKKVCNKLKEHWKKTFA